jgi:hypothetical protein
MPQINPHSFNVSSLNHAISLISFVVQGGSNMTGTNCDFLTHKSPRKFLNHLVKRHTYCICPPPPISCSYVAEK